jgi:hypothetical protein
MESFLHFLVHSLPPAAFLALSPDFDPATQILLRDVHFIAYFPHSEPGLDFNKCLLFDFWRVPLIRPTLIIFIGELLI